MPDLAWVADGQLRLCLDGAPPTTWSSAFADQVAERAVSITRKNAWKHSQRPQGFDPWGTTEQDLGGLRPRAEVLGVSSGRRPGELLYTLRADEVSAVLVRDPGDEPAELRLFHTNQFQVHDVHAEPDQDALALTVGEGVTRHIALLDTDGRRLREITDGDVIDMSPRWALGTKGVLVYQSAGLGRTADGHYAGREPFGICRLDTTRGTHEELARDAAHDLLRPTQDASGALWYLRRPFDDPHKPISWGQALRDLLMAPVRFLRAIFGWASLFSAMYGGEPLITAQGPRRQGPDARRLMLDGMLVDVERARREAEAAGEKAPGLVPQDWVLVRRTAAGEEEVAKGVLAYALQADGTLVWTNGAAVTRRSPEGVTTTLATEAWVTAVCAF